MHLVFSYQLMHCLLFFEHFLGHFRFELRRILFLLLLIV